MYKFIHSYSQFILNETLKTHDINFTTDKIERELSLMRYNFSILKKENKIILTLNNSNYIHHIDVTFDYINSLFIDRHGWFPSEMYLTNLSDNKNILPYDEDYIKNNIKYLIEIKIIYEAKYDILLKNPDKVYHLSIQEFEKSISNKGLIPKSKSKISKHLDRIYLCEYVEDCYKLIPKMKSYYTFKYNGKMNDKWIIYEIDLNNLNINLYKDPNYDKGSYTVDNIHKERIKIHDKE